MAQVDPKLLAEVERKVTHRLLATIPAMILILALPVFAWNGVLQYDADTATWFQRTGSIVVLLAVWIEYMLFRVDRLCNPISGNGVTYQDMAHRDALAIKYNRGISHYKLVVAAIAVTGTIIWGYGDIIRASFA
jgi:hypothetical protein